MSVVIPNGPSIPGGGFTGGFGLPSGPTSGVGLEGRAPDTACTLAGIPAPCTWVDIALSAAGNLFGGQGSEPPAGPSVPGTGLNVPTGNGGGPCGEGCFEAPGGRCVCPGDVFPGGDPFISAPSGQAVHGRFGVGVRPMERQRRQLKCPAGMVLGKDNVCYESLGRRQRKWDPGMKPLLTGGDRAAIRKAAAAARKLKRSRKMIRKASRALDKVC